MLDTAGWGMCSTPATAYWWPPTTETSSLHNLVSDNAVLNTVLNDGSSSSVGMVGLAYNSGGRSHRGTVGHSGTSSVSTGGGNSRAVANKGAAHEGKCDHKSVHVVTALFRRDSH